MIFIVPYDAWVNQCAHASWALHSLRMQQIFFRWDRKWSILMRSKKVSPAPARHMFEGEKV